MSRLQIGSCQVCFAPISEATRCNPHVWFVVLGAFDLYRMIKRLIIFSLLSVLVFGGLFALKVYQMQQTMHQPHRPPPAVVAETEVKQVAWRSSLTAVGSLVAVSGVAVTNEVAGMVKSIYFHSGQNVKQGQLLLELDYSIEQAELQGLLAEQRLAEIRFERSRKLIDGKFVSKSAFDQNQALLDEAKAAVRTKMISIEKKKIRAPFSGRLGIRQVDLGQYLTAGSDIVMLQQLQPIFVDFEIPERHLSRLDTSKNVSVHIQAYPDQVFKGQVSAISPLIDENTRSVKIRATLANARRLLYPGMFAEIQLLSNRTRQLLTLPDSAISYNPYGDFVFVIQSGVQGLTVHSRQVETGIKRAGRVEIVKGLHRGERVVGAGQIKLRNGMPVTIAAMPAPGERDGKTLQ